MAVVHGAALGLELCSVVVDILFNILTWWLLILSFVCCQRYRFLYFLVAATTVLSELTDINC